MNIQSSRSAKFAAAAAVVLAGALASAGFAHPHAEGEKVEKSERVIVISNKQGGKAGEERVRAFHHRGEGGPACEGKLAEVDETTGGEDDKQKTRIVICGDGADSASTVEHLEKALARINDNDALSAEHKAKVTAALRAAIERNRARQD